MAKRGETVCGIVFQSPLNYAATLTPMDPEVVEAVVLAIGAADIALPGVNGDAATAARFAGQWTEHSKAGAVPFQGLRIYEVTEVREWPQTGGLRRNATPEDRNLLLEWVRDFHTETGESLSDAAPIVDRWLDAKQMWIWDDDGPKSMVVKSRPAEGVVRVQAVYTPPEKRGRGYAGACVGELSEQILAGGLRSILYTDLGNAGSNSLYRRLGYRAVAEVLRYRFQ